MRWHNPRAQYVRNLSPSVVSPALAVALAFGRWPRRLMKSQGLQDRQQVVFMSDGRENVRRVQEYVQPGREHWIDWFHITMRVTVLQQQTKP